MDDKPSHEPLLPPGLHDVSEDELSRHFVDPFGDAKKRRELVDGLRRFTNAIKGLGVGFELWLDGSFVTKKPDPDDVDVVVFIPSNQVNALLPEQRQALAMLFVPTYSKAMFGCHAFDVLAEDNMARKGWQDWFGHDRLDRPKGILRMTISQ